MDPLEGLLPDPPDNLRLGNPVMNVTHKFLRAPEAITVGYASTVDKSSVSQRERVIALKAGDNLTAHVRAHSESTDFPDLTQRRVAIEWYDSASKNAGLITASAYPYSTVDAVIVPPFTDAQLKEWREGKSTLLVGLLEDPNVEKRDKAMTLAEQVKVLTELHQAEVDTQQTERLANYLTSEYKDAHRVPNEDMGIQIPLAPSAAIIL